MRHAHWFASQFRDRFGASFGGKCGPIGIEFRDGFARVVQVARDRRAHVLAAACVAYDRAAPERSIEQLAHAILGGGFRGRECVVVLPFEAARLVSMTLPEGDDGCIRADIARALGADADATLEFDFIRLGPIGHASCDIAAVVAEREPIEAIVHPLIDAGLWPSAVEASFVATARACSRTHRRASDHGRVRLALDLHERGATALLLQGQTIVSARSATSRSTAVAALATCHDECHQSFGLERPNEVRISGTQAYDSELVTEIERTTGVTVRHDDDVGTFADAFLEVGVHAADSGGAAAWIGAFGAAFRGLSRAALRHAPHVTATVSREAA